MSETSVEVQVDTPRKHVGTEALNFTLSVCKCMFRCVCGMVIAAQ